MANDKSMGYVQVPMVELESQNPTNVQQPNCLTDEEIVLAKKATRWVILLCFVQLTIAFVGFLCGNFLLMILSALFVSTGIVGAIKQRVKLLTVHFIYSLVLYVISLIAIVLLILYCQGCRWWFYVGGFFIVLFQAIGMRHARVLIFLLKKQAGVNMNCYFQKNKCNMFEEKECKEETPVPQAAELPPNFVYPFPAHQVISMQAQPNVPQYLPFQPVQYPIMQQPINLAAYPNQPQPIGLYPVAYRQV